MKNLNQENILKKVKFDIESQGFNGQPNVIEDQSYISSSLIGISDTEDLVAEKYIVLVKNQNFSLSTEFSTVFNVDNTSNLENKNYYARVYTRSFPTRIRYLLEFKNSDIPGFNTPKAVEIVQLSEHKRQYLTSIFLKPTGKSLSDLIAEEYRFSEKFIIEKIIYPLSQVIDKLHSKALLHGNINLDTIFLDENDNVLLDECFSGPCGVNQKMIFETPQRLQVAPYAKDCINYSADYYALGIVAISLLKGKDFLSEINGDDTIKKRLENGSYNYFTKDLPLNNTLDLLLQGMLSDNTAQRWNHREIKSAIKNQEFHNTIITSNTRAKKPIIFNEKQFFDLKTLAH